MGRRFQELAFTPVVKQEQEKHGSREKYQRAYDHGRPGDALGAQEQAFIAARDSFYMASVSETGWPYIQHRGGAAGFLHVIDPKLVASRICAATSSTSAWAISNMTLALRCS